MEMFIVLVVIIAIILLFVGLSGQGDEYTPPKEGYRYVEAKIPNAEITPKGCVYVLSNYGSFGEDVYKIGMTRRDDPLDRVKELGDASVPFIFDVHAIVHTDSAPELEKHLHEKFDAYRVNKVNKRKEFFKLPLELIRDEIVSLGYPEERFDMEALAYDWNESKKLTAEIEKLELDKIEE